MIKNKGCCDLKYAIELKKLGVKQESEWYWFKNPHGEGWLLNNNGSKKLEHVSAFTVAEVEKMLYTHGIRNYYFGANLKAEKLIYLIKEGLIKL